MQTQPLTLTFAAPKKHHGRKPHEIGSMNSPYPLLESTTQNELVFGPSVVQEYHGLEPASSGKVKYAQRCFIVAEEDGSYKTVQAIVDTRWTERGRELKVKWDDSWVLESQLL